jgi:F-type H+-transporting ATPase subunit delta
MRDLHGASRASLAAAEERLEPLLAAVDGTELGQELFGVTRLLDASGALRRALTDPSATPRTKVDLVRRLLEGKVSSATVDVVSGLVRERWSQARDIADACEHLGAVAVLASAERDGVLDAVEDELFRFGRLVQADRELAAVLSDRAVAAARKTELVERLLAGKVARQTLVLVEEAVTHPRGRRLADALEDFGAIAARQRERLVADVVAAVPLTEAQRARLTATLRRLYGRPFRLNVDVDPEVLGGLRVQVGDEVIDGTVLRRLDDARRRLVG